MAAVFELESSEREPEMARAELGVETVSTG